MSFLHGFKKSAGVGMIALSLLLLFPQKTYAQYVDVSNAVKEYVADTIVFTIINTVLSKLTASTVNWINSGFEGNPGYVTDPKQFFLDVGDRVASDVLSSTALNNLCSPFKAQVRLALVKNYINDNQNYACTLSKVKDNYDQFTQDFSKGGWEGWFEVTQNNQNNPYGAYLDAKNQLSIQVGTEKETKQKELEQGQGFLSVEKCKSNAKKWTQAEIDDARKREAAGSVRFGVGVIPDSPGCSSSEKETVTPGSLVQSQLTKVFGEGVSRLGAADEVDEIIGALLNQLISKTLSSLKGASEKTAGSGKSFADQLRDEAARPISNPNPVSTNPTVNCTTDENGEMSCSTRETRPIRTCTRNIDGETTCVDTPTNGGGGGDPGGGPSDGYVTPPEIDFGGGNPTYDPGDYDFPYVYTGYGNDQRDSADVSNSSISFTQESGNHAQFVSQQVPQSVPLRKLFNAKITFLNTGTTTWKAGDKYELGSQNPLGTQFWRIGLVRLKTDVLPGQQVTFGFLNYPPMDPGTHNFQWQMVQGDVEWFGDNTPNIAIRAGDAGATAIVSVRPLLVHAGETQITIVGRNLTNSVQLTDASGQVHSATGSVNSDKTETTALVPSNMPKGVTTVKVSGNGVSNGRLIQITDKPLPNRGPSDYGQTLRNGDTIGAMAGSCRDITWLDRNSTVALVNAKPGWTYHDLADVVWQGVRDEEALTTQYYCILAGLNTTVFTPETAAKVAHNLAFYPTLKESFIKAIENYEALEIDRKGISCIPDLRPAVCAPYRQFVGRYASSTPSGGTVGGN